MKKALVGFFFLSFLLLSHINLNSQNKYGNDHYNFINANELKMWISNNGSSANDPYTGRGGLIWRTNSNLVFQEGFLWTGNLGRKTFIGGNTNKMSLQAGKILQSGKLDKADLEKYRVYRIKKDWQSLAPGDLKKAFQKDYDEWSVEDGAPWIDKDNNGIYNKGIDAPDFIGDECIWFVSNDMDTTRTLRLWGEYPVGLEIQTTVFAFDRTNVLGRTIFKKLKMINKSNQTITGMIFGYWIDPDIGDSYNDYIGCDTLLNLAYSYNSTNYDNYLNLNNPPAIGYLLLQGPIVKSDYNTSAYFNSSWLNGYENIKMSSFSLELQNWMDPPPVDYSNEMKNLLHGLYKTGNPVINPVTNVTTNYSLSGDPVNKTGWYEGEGWPGFEDLNGDRRMILGTGPIDFAPGDTQEVVISTIVAQGSDNIDAITELKADAARIQYFYNGVTLPTDVEKENVVIGFSLSQNYPNPFNPTTKIKFTIPTSPQPSPYQGEGAGLPVGQAGERLISLKIFDILGNEVAMLNKEINTPGEYEIEFDAGKYNLSSGVYFYQLRSGNFVASKKMCLIK